MKADMMLKTLALALATLQGTRTLAAGFGLYEMSAKATGMGGHVFARPVDASANYYNPATISSLTGTVATVGFSTLHPTLDTEVNGVGTHKMDPGCFIVPNAFVSQELPAGFAAGIGFYADYGLGSHYDNSWPLAWDSVESKFEGYTVNPNISYRITDKWSAAAGVRLVHATFDQRRIMNLGPYGKMRMKFDLDNDVDVGYVLGTAYDVTDDFSVGAVYRTRVRADLEGDCRSSGSPLAPACSGDVGDKLDMPSSATVGFNWDVLEPLHFGSSLTWTEWSTVDTLAFALPAGRQVMDLRWHDAYRTGFGFTYDFTESFSGMLGYVYDWDPTREKRPATMLPAGDRHIVSFGAAYRIGGWELSAAYGMIIMESKTAHYSDMFGNAYKLRTDNSYTHCVCVTLSRAF